MTFLKCILKPLEMPVGIGPCDDSLLLGVFQLVHLANPMSPFHFTASCDLARNLVLSKKTHKLTTTKLEHLNIYCPFALHTDL